VVLGLMMYWMFGIVSEVLVMLVVRMIWCLVWGLNMWCCLVDDSCVYSGSILVL